MTPAEILAAWRADLAQQLAEAEAAILAAKEAEAEALAALSPVKARAAAIAEAVRVGLAQQRDRDPSAFLGSRLGEIREQARAAEQPLHAARRAKAEAERQAGILRQAAAQLDAIAAATATQAAA